MAAAICAGVLVSLLFLSYIMSSGLLHRRDTGITLPTGEADTPVVTADSQLLTAQSVADVDITTDNVQHVIASLTRPEAYKTNYIIPAARPLSAVAATFATASFARIP
mgnify:CR=1 FL=1